MKAMPDVTHTYDIKTTFGVVRIYEWSSESTKTKIPMVLLPGRSSGTPMWANNLKDFIKTRTVYTIDALGDAGMSVQTSPLKTSEDQAQWVEEVCTALKLTKVHIVGHSFGGWSAANYASRYPSKVASVCLIEPVFTFQSIKPIIFLKSIPYSIKFLPKSWRQGLLKEIAGTDNIERSDPLARMIDDGAEYYVAKLPAPTQISQEQMRRWNFPVYVALGGKSAVHDSTKGWETAKNNIQSLSGKIWPEGTHSLPMEHSEEIDKEIVEFVDAID